MKKGGIICFIVLLVAVFMITPAMGDLIKADDKIDYVTIELFDTTGKIPIKKEIEITKEEWNILREELREKRGNDEFLEAQFDVLKEHGFVSNDFSYDQYLKNVQEKSYNGLFSRLPQPDPLINNSNFNGMCGISFELNGTTLVFGLNSFVNLVGFNIISFHKGYATDGISTFGLVQRTSEPGEYVGTMFGFLGSWFGEKTMTGVYSDVTCTGFTVLTGWLPVNI